MTKRCPKCLLPLEHPFGIYNVDGICSGCQSFSLRKRHLPQWNNIDLSALRLRLESVIGYLPSRVIVPFDPDGETWFVLDTLIRLGIKPTVSYFNMQYHDKIFYSILNSCQEHFDVDFVGFSFPKDIIRSALSEEISVGYPHPRNLEILARHVSALYLADHFSIKHIFEGPNQQSEIVGSHSFIVPNQLKKPALKDIVLGSQLLSHVESLVLKQNTLFAKSFRMESVAASLERVSWHFLSDYIFWDSVSINNYYADKFYVTPRYIPAIGHCWQASSSSLKLEFFDLIRYIHTNSTKIDSYLSRDLRFNRISTSDAINMRHNYLNKKWDLNSAAYFFEVSALSLHKMIDLLIIRSRSPYKPSYLDPCAPVDPPPVSYYQCIF